MPHAIFDDPRIASKYAPVGTAAHPVKRGVVPATCMTCKGMIGDPTTDPVHNVPAVCEHCGLPTPPFRTTHDACSDAKAAAFKAAWRGVAVPDPVGEARERSSGVSDGQPKPGHPRAAEVRAYLLAYAGTNSFLTDMRLVVLGRTKWDRLTDRQIDAVGRFIDNDRPRPAREQSGRDLTAFPVGRTRAAVTNDSGTTTFLLIDRPKPDHERWGGWVFVKQQQGPTEVRLGSQRPGETYSGQWPTLIDRVLADIEAAVARYGHELGRCGVCDLPLTNEESREYGIGPVCRARLRDATR